MLKHNLLMEESLGDTVATRTLTAILLSCLLVAVTCGCGGGPKLPPMAEVSGQVTLDGKPLPRGTVQFVPDTAGGTSGPPATGNIDSTGHYVLRTAGVEGAVVGRHLVAVESREEVPSDGISWAPTLIPETYNNPNASGLKFEVKAGEDNVINLELTAKP